MRCQIQLSLSECEATALDCEAIRIGVTRSVLVRIIFHLWMKNNLDRRALLLQLEGKTERRFLKNETKSECYPLSDLEAPNQGGAD
jgi:hypothetical protein